MSAGAGASEALLTHLGPVSGLTAMIERAQQRKA
jgi:hypothetical protein